MEDITKVIREIEEGMERELHQIRSQILDRFDALEERLEALEARLASTGEK